MAERDYPRVLILTPVKDAVEVAETYARNLEAISYPRDRLSLGILEGDSRDDSAIVYRHLVTEFSQYFRRTGFWSKNFGFNIPPDTPRWDPAIQVQRRSILAKSRNHLLFRALDDEDWVLWLDADVIEYPPDILQTLLSYGKDVIQPHCVLEYGGSTFDMNGWREHGKYFLQHLRAEGEVVPLDTVGGTALLVRADLHRDGLIFPPYFYGARNDRARSLKRYIATDEFGEIETEGLGIMADDMGIECWGLPGLEILHRNK